MEPYIFIILISRSPVTLVALSPFASTLLNMVHTMVKYLFVVQYIQISKIEQRPVPHGS